jgi:hypothetical protein
MNCSGAITNEVGAQFPAVTERMLNGHCGEFSLSFLPTVKVKQRYQAFQIKPK